MERVDFGTIVQQVISKFHQNRVGQKPPVFVMISGSLPHVPWHDRSLREFTRLFVYESLLTNDPDATVEIAVRRKAELRDLNKFVGIHPTYWVQLRVSGRGLKIMEHSVEDLLTDLGYRCEEWIGVQDAGARLGIFGTVHKSESKLVFCLEWSRQTLKCDLLLPIYEAFPVPCPAANHSKPEAPN